MNSFDPSHITTPIALAAVAVAGLFGLLNLLVRKAAKGQVKTLIHWTFITAIVISLSILVFLLVSALISGEVRVSGEIVDDDGNPIQNANVNLVGVGSTQSLMNGDFQILVPESRRADLYTLQISSPGYSFKKTMLSGPRPGPQVYVGSRVDVGPPIRINSDFVLVGHHLGMPYVRLRTLLSNSTPGDIQFTDVAVSLTSPSGGKYLLTPLQLEAPSGMILGPALATYTLKPRDSDDWTIWYTKVDPSIYSLSGSVLKQLSPKPGEAPDPNVVRLDESTTAKLRATMQSNFIWASGKWTLELGAQAGPKSATDIRVFSLSDAQVTAMLRVTNLYQTGIGVMNQWIIWNSGDIQTEVRVPITVQ